MSENDPTLLVPGNLKSPVGDPTVDFGDIRPIDYILDWFAARERRVGIGNRVLILKSETASGKSTVIPPELYKKFIKNMGRVPGIICTQPRVLTAIENVNEIIPYHSKDLRKGENIGWNTQSNKLSISAPGIMSATVGILTQQLRMHSDQEIMDMYKYILIDEVHERGNIDIDLTICMLKGLLRRQINNVKCPFIVLMSATFDPRPFLDYFGLDILQNHIWVTGATAVITDHYDWNAGRTVANYPRAAADVVEIIMSTEPKQISSGQMNPNTGVNILIFMPGAAEIAETGKWLDILNKKIASNGGVPFIRYAIDGDAVRENRPEYLAAKDAPLDTQTVLIDGKKYAPGRKVIISTNVAETGITLKALRYVIDGGFNNEVEFDPATGISGLLTKPAPKSRITQRRGRAGRKYPGEFYPLYPMHIWEMMPDDQLPGIMLSDISAYMIGLICEQLKTKMLLGGNDEFSIDDLDLVTMPSADALAYSIEKLYAVGFIEISCSTTSGAASTDSGRIKLSELGRISHDCFGDLPPDITRMILGAYFWNVATIDIITIAAWLMEDPKSYKGERDAPINWNDVYDSGVPGHMKTPNIIFKMRLMLADEFIDGLVLYNALRRVSGSHDLSMNMRAITDWCIGAKLSVAGCMGFIKRREDLIALMLERGMNVYGNVAARILDSSSDTIMNVFTRIKYCIYDGFKCNIMRRQEGSNIYTTRNGVTVNAPALFSDTEIKRAKAREMGYIVKTLPRALIYSALTFKAGRNGKPGKIKAVRVSMLDGFISEDTGYFTGS